MCNAGSSNELHLSSKRAAEEIIYVFLTVIICSLMLLNTDKREQREYPDDNAYSATQTAIKALLFLVWPQKLGACTFLCITPMEGWRQTYAHRSAAHTHSGAENKHTLNTNSSCCPTLAIMQTPRKDIPPSLLLNKQLALSCF